MKIVVTVVAIMTATLVVVLSGVADDVEPPRLFVHGHAVPGPYLESDIVVKEGAVWVKGFRCYPGPALEDQDEIMESVRVEREGPSPHAVMQEARRMQGRAEVEGAPSGTPASEVVSFLEDHTAIEWIRHEGGYSYTIKFREAQFPLDMTVAPLTPEIEAERERLKTEAEERYLEGLRDSLQHSLVHSEDIVLFGDGKRTAYPKMSREYFEQLRAEIADAIAGRWRGELLDATIVESLGRPVPMEAVREGAANR